MASRLRRISGRPMTPKKEHYPWPIGNAWTGALTPEKVWPFVQMTGPGRSRRDSV
jgi:hypothetical protein